MTWTRKSNPIGHYWFEHLYPCHFREWQNTPSDISDCYLVDSVWPPFISNVHNIVTVRRATVRMNDFLFSFGHVCNDDGPALRISVLCDSTYNRTFLLSVTLWWACLPTKLSIILRLHEALFSLSVIHELHTVPFVRRTMELAH